jgi:hypothetical protein
MSALTLCVGQDFSDDPAKLQAYLQAMSGHFRDRGE